MTYSEKLKDPRWQRKRLEILNRDGFTCCHCGDTESTLNIHHHYYEKKKMPWDYPDGALITLCEHCHKSAEAKKEKIIKAIANPFVMDALAVFCEMNLELLQSVQLAFGYGPEDEDVQQMRHRQNKFCKKVADYANLIITKNNK